MLNGRRSGGRVVMSSPSARHRPGVRPLEARHDLEERRLPASARAEQAEERPGGMSRSRVCSATVGPKRFETPRMLTAPVVVMRPSPVPRQARRPPSRDARVRCHRSAMPDREPGHEQRIVATAFTDGSIVRRSRDSTNSGSVCVVPEVKLVISTSSKEIANATTIAPRIEGATSGKRDPAQDRLRRGAQVPRGLLDRDVVVPQPCAHDQDHERRRDDHVPGHDRPHRRVDRERLHRRHQRDPDEQRRQHHGDPRPALEQPSSAGTGAERTRTPPWCPRHRQRARSRRPRSRSLSVPNGTPRPRRSAGTTGARGPEAASSGSNRR